jgi:hypothetical protein
MTAQRLLQCAKVGHSLGGQADAAFANPDVYEFLEADGIKYAIRFPANRVLQDRIGYLLKRLAERPSNEVRRHHASFSYRAATWDKSRRVIAKAEWHPGELYPRVGLIVTNMSRPQALSPLRRGFLLVSRSNNRNNLTLFGVVGCKGQPLQPGGEGLMLKRPNAQLLAEIAASCFQFYVSIVDPSILAQPLGLAGATPDRGAINTVAAPKAAANKTPVTTAPAQGGSGQSSGLSGAMQQGAIQPKTP